MVCTFEVEITFLDSRLFIYFRLQYKLDLIHFSIHANAMKFEEALSFNQDLSTWDVRNNENFFSMFANARSYNQSLCPWRSTIRASTNVTGMFNGTSCLNTTDPASSSGLFLSDGPFCHRN